MGRGRLEWRAWRGLVLWPLVAGVALCGLSVWAAVAHARSLAAFRASAVPARAAIDRVYAGQVYQGDAGGSSFDQYAMVRFAARGVTAHARVLLVPGCSAVCLPRYHAGQVITVYYSPQNLNYAQLRPGGFGNGTDDAIAAVVLSGVFGLIFLTAAVVNLLTAGRPGAAGSGADPAADAL